MKRVRYFRGTPEERFWHYVNKNDSCCDCWERTAMTKHTDTSRSTDSGVSGNAQTSAREIRPQQCTSWYFGTHPCRLLDGHDGGHSADKCTHGTEASDCTICYQWFGVPKDGASTAMCDKDFHYSGFFVEKSQLEHWEKQMEQESADGKEMAEVRIHNFLAAVKTALHFFKEEV